MASVGVWLEVLSYVKALFEAITLGADVRKQYRKHRVERDTIAEAERVSQVFRRIQRQRFKPSLVA